MAIALLWNSLIGWTDLVILLALYMLSGVGITVALPLERVAEQGQ